MKNKNCINVDQIVRKNLMLFLRLRAKSKAELNKKTMKQETEWIKELLPNHYTCESRNNGVHCYSEKGIDENDSEHWDYIMKAIKQKFKERFIEVFHQTYTNHKQFTVFIIK